MHDHAESISSTPQKQHAHSEMGLIERAILELRSELEVLDKDISEVYNKFSPVLAEDLSDNTADDRTDPTPDRINSVYLEEIQRLKAHVIGQQSLLRLLMERCEL